MKKHHLIISVLLAIIGGEARCQTHIYERFADRADLEVAYVENLPLDSVTTINATILIAKDTAAWKRLIDEFHFECRPITPYADRAQIVKKLRDRTDPTEETHGTMLESYLVAVNYRRCSIAVYQYQSIRQYHAIIHFSNQKLSHEN